jgi:hypothetical protein
LARQNIQLALGDKLDLVKTVPKFVTPVTFGEKQKQQQNLPMQLCILSEKILLFDSQLSFLGYKKAGLFLRLLRKIGFTNSSK